MGALGAPTVWPRKGPTVAGVLEVAPSHLVPLRAEHLQPQQSAADHPRPKRARTAATARPVAPLQVQAPNAAVVQQQWTELLATKKAMQPAAQVKAVELPAVPLRAEERTLP